MKPRALPLPVRVVLAAALLGGGVASASGRSVLARFEVEGPLSELRFDGGAAGETRVEGALLAGERRELVLPIPVLEEAAPREPRPSWHAAPGLEGESAGRVRFRGWVAPQGPGWEDAPIALRARPRPPAGRASPRLSPALGWLLAAVFVAGLSLRRRPAAAAPVSAAGVLLVLALGPRPDPEGAGGAGTTVIEGSAESELWLRVEAARDRLTVAAGEELGRVEVEPPGAPLLWRVPITGRGEMRLEARGARLARIVVEPRAERLATRASQQLDLDLAAAWVRDGGEWSVHGAWPQGEPLPPPRPAPPPSAGADPARGPPGWLASGLPQGTSVLLGRVDRARPVWVRISGF